MEYRLGSLIKVRGYVYEIIAEFDDYFIARKFGETALCIRAINKKTLEDEPVKNMDYLTSKRDNEKYLADNVVANNNASKEAELADNEQASYTHGKSAHGKNK